MNNKLLLEKDYEKIYQNLRNYCLLDKGLNLLEESVGNTFFITKNKNGTNYIYKLAKNTLGLKLNEKEIELSNLNSCFSESFQVYNNSNFLIKTKFPNNIKSHILHKVKTSYSLMDSDKLTLLNAILDYNYFLELNLFKKRNVSKQKLDNNLSQFEKRFKLLSLNRSNIYIDKFIEIVVKYNLEPADMIKRAFIDEFDNIKFLQYGLTEQVFFQNLRRVSLNVDLNDSILKFNVGVVKRFNGKFSPTDDVLDKIKKEFNSDSLEEFYFNTFKEKIDFSDESIYSDNNIFIK